MSNEKTVTNQEIAAAVQNLFGAGIDIKLCGECEFRNTSKAPKITVVNEYPQSIVVSGKWVDDELVLTVLSRAETKRGTLLAPGREVRIE